MQVDLSWTLSGGHLFGVVDVELTNRCNASCSFCPRDLTPHQGVMTEAVFEQVLARVLEFQDGLGDVLLKPPTVSFCGLGEQLLNRNVGDFVGRLTDAGLDSVVNTNAALLDERRGRALLEAGIGAVVINGGEVDGDYEATYGLPFGRMRDNVAHFVDQAAGRCTIYLVLVDHGHDAAHVEEVEQHWRSVGVTHFFRLELLNRAGSLAIDGMDYDDTRRPPEATRLWRDVAGSAACDAPFQFPFIGYDGTYYLCSSDWQKEVSFGSVFDRSIVDVMAEKLRVVTRRTPICAACNHDPLNRLTDLVRAAAGDATASEEVGKVADVMRVRADNARAALEALGVRTDTLPDPVLGPDGSGEARRLIPVVAR